MHKHHSGVQLSTLETFLRIFGMFDLFRTLSASQKTVKRTEFGLMVAQIRYVRPFSGKQTKSGKGRTYKKSSKMFKCQVGL